MYKEFRTNATSFSGSTQNEGNKKLLEVAMRAFSSSIMPSVGVFYLYTVLKDETDAKVKSNDSLINANKELAAKDFNTIKDLINANKETVEKEIKANKELINANKELINANKELINANKEMVEKEIKANKEMVEKEIKANKEIAENEIKANKEMVEMEIKANKEISVEMIKAYGANIENLILKKGWC